MADGLCSECIEDRFLRQIVQGEGTEGRCDVCDHDRPSVITVNRLGALLEPIIQKNYRPGEQFPPDWEQEGDDLDFVTQEVLGQYFDFNDEIIDAVIAAEDCDPRDGDIPFFERGTNYIGIPASGAKLHTQWAYVQNELSTTRRFFSSAAEAFFDELFEDFDGVLAVEETKTDRGVVTELPAGSIIYRGRICADELLPIFKDPFKQVGPPPPRYARAGRMSADGISIFYGATDKDTCLAELRPAIGQQSAVITLHTTEALRILDFTRMPKVYKALSFFQPDFDEQAEKLSFLRILGTLISRPVTPGQEREYLITQTMMEYLAHVYRDPVEGKSFDGVVFQSAQCRDGRNVVLFPRIEKDEPIFPIKYVVDSLTIHSTETIAYKHREVHYLFDGNAVRVDWSEFDF